MPSQATYERMAVQAMRRSTPMRAKLTSTLSSLPAITHPVPARTHHTPTHIPTSQSLLLPSQAHETMFPPPLISRLADPFIGVATGPSISAPPLA